MGRKASGSFHGQGLGTLSTHLREVSSVHREARVVGVVVLGLGGPVVDSLPSDAGVRASSAGPEVLAIGACEASARCQSGSGSRVKEVLTLRVLEFAVVGPLLGVALKRGVPRHRASVVLVANIVAEVES